jgi:hypothetical protein
MSESLDHLRWGGKKEAIPLIMKDGEIGGECRSVGGPHRGSENGLERYTRLFHKHAKRGFAIFQAVAIAGMPDEEAVCPFKSLEACVISMLERWVVGVKVLTSEESEGIQVHRRRANKDRV